MAVETLDPGAPIVANRLLKVDDETRTTADRKNEAKKTVPTNPNAKVGNKQKKLYAHLLVGLFMIITVIAGYAIFGPASQVSAAEITTNTVVETTNTETTIMISVPPPFENGQVDDLAALQAEMDAIMRQMDALQAQNYTGNNLNENNAAMNTAQINQMMTRMNQLTGTMNSVYSQNGSMSIPATSAGHGH